MSDTSGGQGESQAGPRLAAHIDYLRGNQSVRQFALTHGLDPARISTWRGGTVPSLDALRQVADGLRLPLGELLIKIGMGTTADFTVADRPRDLSVAHAVENDPDLLPRERRLLRDFLAMLRDARSNDSVTVSSGKPRQGRTIRP